MPKVKMVTRGSGPVRGWQPGDTIECSEQEVADFVPRCGTLVEEPKAPDFEPADEAAKEDALMALSNDELLELCAANGITGLPSRPTKVQLVGVLRSHGVSIASEPEPETAELAGGEVAASTEAPQPRERVASHDAD